MCQERRLNHSRCLKSILFYDYIMWFIRSRCFHRFVRSWLNSSYHFSLIVSFCSHSSSQSMFHHFRVIYLHLSSLMYWFFYSFSILSFIFVTYHMSHQLFIFRYSSLFFRRSNFLFIYIFFLNLFFLRLSASFFVQTFMHHSVLSFR